MFPRPCVAIFIVLALTLLVGCKPEPFVPTVPWALDGTTFTVDPLPQSPCDPSKPYAASVRWSVTDWDDAKFDILLESSTGPLWARENRAQGEKRTDAFVRPGLWFVMLDRNSRIVVAATPAPELVCPEAPPATP